MELKEKIKRIIAGKSISERAAERGIEEIEQLLIKEKIELLKEIIEFWNINNNKDCVAFFAEKVGKLKSQLK